MNPKNIFWSAIFSLALTISANAQYCITGPITNGEGNITNVVFNGATYNISNFTGCPTTPGFENYTLVDSANVIEGNSYTVTVTISPCGGFALDPGACQGWIDWNQNGVYNTTESIGSWTGNIYGSAKTATFTFTVPAGVSAGRTRLRLLLRQGYGTANTPPLDPCGTGFNYGSVEDYTVRVATLVTPCPNPSSPTAASVTDTSAQLNWTSAGTAFNVEYGVAGFALGSGTIVNTTANTLLLDNLNPATNYSYYVRNNCTLGGNGTSSWIGPINFTTLCAVQNMPYLESFAAPAPCFKTDGGSLNFVHDIGGQYMYAPIDGSGAGATAFLTSPRVLISADAQLTFKWSHAKVSWANDKLYAYIREYGTTIWVLVWSKTGNDLNSGSGVFVSELVNLSSAYNGKTVELKFVGEAGGYGSNIFVDDVSVSAQPACALPTNISFSNIQANTADINFVGASGSYHLEWGPAGFTQGTGVTDTATGSPFTLHSLVVNTTYDVYLKRDCTSSGNGWTAWLGPFTFTTVCGNYPTTYLSNFDADSTGLVPVCWSFVKTSGNGSAVIYKPSTSQSLQAFSAPKLVLYNSPGSNSALVSPSFSTLPLNGKQVEFKAQRGFSSNLPATLYAGTLSNPTNPSTFVVADTIVVGTTWQNYTVVLNAVPAGHTHFAFRVDPNLGSSSVAIDDFLLTDQPACLPPSNFKSKNITGNSAVISWAANNATAWSIEYGLAGFSLGSGTVVSGLTAPTYALTGLGQSVCYDVYITSQCGMFTNAAGPFQFCTLCSATAIPFTENFATWPLSCWSATSGANAFTAYNAGGLQMAQAAATYWPAGSNAVLRTKAFNINQEVQVSFKWSHLAAADQLYFYARVQPSDDWDTLKTWSGANFSSPATGINPSKFVPNQLIDEVLYLDSATYTNKIVEFKFELVATGAAAGATLFIDDFAVLPVPACPEPINFSTTNITGHTALANWQGTGSTFVIEYGPTGFTQGTGGSLFDTTSTTSYAFSALLPITFYDYYVRSLCGPNGNSAWKGPYTFTTGVSCPAPTAVAITNQTLTSVWASWQTGGASTWNIAVNSTPNIGTATKTFGIAADSVLLGGLNAATNNYFWVRDSCGPADVSVWIGPIAFSTTCTSFPLNYAENFNAWTPTNVPTCWSHNLGDLPWNAYTVGGGNMARFGAMQSLVGQTGLLSSPEINITDAAVLHFKWSHMVDVNNPNDTLFVLIKTAGAASWNTLASYHHGNFNTPNATAGLPAAVLSAATHNIPTSYTGQKIEIAFYVVSGSGADVFIDDVVVEAIPATAACLPPTNVSATNFTQTSATLNWTSTGNSWQISYGIGITNPTNGTKVLATAKPYVLSGLTSGSHYSIFTRKICGVDDTSAWTLATFANTSCSTFAMPFVEDFAAWTNPDFLACWNLEGGSQKLFPQATSGTSLISARADIFYTWQYGDDAFLTSPQIAITQNAILLLEWSKEHRATFNDSMIVLSRIVGAAAWDTVAVYEGTSFACNCTPTGSPNQIGFLNTDTLSLPATYVGQNIETALHIIGNKGYTLYINKISILADPAFVCSASTAVAASAISCVNATITWQSTNNTLSNNVIFGPAGFNPATAGTTIFGATSPYVLNGLQPATNYDVYVEDSCVVGLSNLANVSFTTTNSPLPILVAAHVVNAPTFSSLSVNFDASSSLNANTYKWLFGDGDSSNLATVAHAYTANGTYTVTLFANGDCGTVDTTFTVVIAGIGLDENQLNSAVLLYPNPTNGLLQVQTANVWQKAEVYDVTGRLLYSQPHPTTEIDLGHMPAGMYTVKIYFTSGVSAQRVVKR